MLVVLVPTVWASTPAVPVDVRASSSFVASLTGPQRVVDHSGWAGHRHDDHPLGHTMWLTTDGPQAANPAGLDTSAWIQLDLGRERALEDLTVWNYNQRGLTDRGLRDVRLHYSTDGVSWSELGSYMLAEASGSPSLPPTDVIPLDVRARHLLITADPERGTHGSDFAGLSELGLTASDGDPGCVWPSDHPLTLRDVRIPDTDRLHALPPTGWLGADIAHSVPLDENRSVWLYGDTLLGTAPEGVRDPSTASLVNGSVAIQDRTRPLAEQMAYHWGSDPTGWFGYQGPPDAGRFYWTTNGVLIEGELFVFAMNVTSLFEQRGVSVLRVSNPEEEPNDWVTDHRFLDLGGTRRMFHSGLYVEEGWVYLFGFDDMEGPRRTVLARVPVDALQRGLTVGDYEYWVDGPSGLGWSSEDEGLATVIDVGVTESSVTFDASLGRYLYALSSLDGSMLLSTATELTGPWTPPACVYRAPEAAWVPLPLISYAARLHPELADAPGTVPLSYVTNTTGGLEGLYGIDGAVVYRPRMIEVTFELPDTTVTETASDTGVPATPEPSTCGCATGGMDPVWMVLPLAWGARRRRRWRGDGTRDGRRRHS